MSLPHFQAAIVAAALGVCVSASLVFAGTASAQDNCRNCGRSFGGRGGQTCSGPNCLPREAPRPDLFYNFYVGPNCGGVPAELYPAPIPTPPLVGHTYYTYQPLMPHEMLYPHKRTYHQYYNYGRGLNRTTVRWW